jgi:hypothetical protein
VVHSEGVKVPKPLLLLFPPAFGVPFGLDLEEAATHVDLVLVGLSPLVPEIDTETVAISSYFS